jgi:hypothetical protein
MVPTIQTPKTAYELPLALIKNMITLATSGFGLVVALAWNELIQKTVEEYINPYLGKDSGLISMLIYAVAMTFLAVLITTQLTFVQSRLEGLHKKD